MNRGPEGGRGQGWTAAWVLGVLGTLLIMVVLVGALIRYTRPPDIAAARAVERARFLAEVRQGEAKAVTAYAWQDKAKGFVRLPIADVLPIVLKEWQQPAAARSNLIARVEKATEVPPPPPAAPNPYE